MVAGASRPAVRWLFSFCCMFTTVLEADDVAIYAPDQSKHRVFLHVLLDLGDLEEDTVLCRVGEDCAPPFLSAAAYQHLLERYSTGDAVTEPGVFLAVLAAVLDRPDLNALEVAVSIPNHEANPPGDPHINLGGATFFQGFRSLVENRDETQALLRSLPFPSGSSSHALQPREAYVEWLRYLNGDEPALALNTLGNFGSALSGPSFDSALLAGGRYVSPVPQGSCARHYSLVFALRGPREDDDLDAELAAGTALPGNTPLGELLTHLHDPARAPLMRSGSRAVLRDSWLVTSAARAQEVRAIADAVHGGVLLLDDPLALERKLGEKLLGTLAGWDIPYRFAFAPSADTDEGILPIAFLTLGAGSLSTEWRGNVKKLQLSAGDTVQSTLANPYGERPLELLDALGRAAIETEGPRTGLLARNALTYWTRTDAVLQEEGPGHAENADGATVDRGGAGQNIDGFVPRYRTDQSNDVYLIGESNDDVSEAGHLARQVYMLNGTGDGFDGLEAASDTVRRIMAAAGNDKVTQDEASGLIRWMRGQQHDSGESRARPWLLGPSAHSRPVAINYGAVDGYSPDNPRVRLFFGSGDGLFRIVENTNPDGSDSGREVFAFMPQESIPEMYRRYVGTQPLSLSPYGADGPVVSWVEDINRDGRIEHADGDRAYIYFGLRRGGRSYYAIDVSDPDTVPQLLWRISATSGGDFDELGLAFSEPIVGKVNYSGEDETALVFAGGYHGGWNEGMTARLGKDLSPADDAMGSAVYIVSAETGVLLWKAVHGSTGSASNTSYAHAGLVDSIPSRITPMLSATGVIDRLYVGDTGGAVWRVDLSQNHSGAEDHRKDSWFISKLAELGTDAAETGGSRADDRRFFHAPDIVRSRDSVGPFDGVLIQSGNRAEPDAQGTRDYLFYIKDRFVDSGSDELRDSARPAQTGFDDLPDRSSCESSTDGVADPVESSGCTEDDLSSGWKLPLGEQGEKGLSSPLVDGGRVFYTTYVPADANAEGCDTGPGSSRVRVTRLSDAVPVIGSHRVGDLGSGLPDDVRRLGEFLYIPGRPAPLFDIDGDGEEDATSFIPSLARRRYSIYWRDLGVDPL